MCLCHSLVPGDFIDTTVVPLLKNKSCDHGRRNGLESGTAEGVEHRATGGGERRCRSHRRVLPLTDKGSGEIF